MSDDLDNNKPQPPAGNAPRGSRRNRQEGSSQRGSAPRGSRRAQQDSILPTAAPARPKRGTPGTASQRKFMTQQQKEAMYQRWLYIGLAVAAGLIVLTLGIGALWQFQIMPNQVLATVNGEEITRKDYWKYQNITLYNEARVYENMALQFTGQEQSQYLLYSTQLDSAREDIEGNTDVSEATLSQMIEDKLYVQAAEEQGVDMSRPVLMQTALNTWAPTDAPLVTPIPSPTMIPQRAEWATQTAEAIQTQEAEMAAMMGTPMATPVVDSGTPGATPVIEATPDMDAVQRDAEAEYQIFLDEVLADTGLSEDEYLELFAKPQVARAHVHAQIVEGIPQSAPQVEVSHIMVGTEDLANQVHDEVTSGDQTFGDAASIWSQDMATSGNDGQLGWVREGELPDEIDAVIFNMEPGDISEPIETPFGWHIVMVTDRDEDRPLSITQYDSAVQMAEEEFLEQARAENDISSDHYDPQPLPTASVFTPPVDAPTPIVATPVTAPDLSATPIAGPAFPTPAVEDATPVASPVTGPVLGPDEATPEASPVASPVASPEASPAATP